MNNFSYSLPNYIYQREPRGFFCVYKLDKMRWGDENV